MRKTILAAGMLLAAAVLSGRELQVNGNFRKINKTTNTPGAWSTEAKKDTVETKILPGRKPGVNAFQIRPRKEVCYYAGPQNVEKGEKITFSADVKGALALVGAAFLSGILGLVWEELPWVLAVHKALSMACVFFLAIHIFVCRHGFKGD